MVLAQGFFNIDRQKKLNLEDNQKTQPLGGTSLELEKLNFWQNFEGFPKMPLSLTIFIQQQNI